ncbi:MAG: hypothetical protein JWL75_466 [Parcubacteria group bacterium]|nr:hypothetical protein [Parcubacteria group bacterium]
MEDTSAPPVPAGPDHVTCNNIFDAKAVIPESQAETIVTLAESGVWPSSPISSWSFQMWELYFSRLTAMASPEFYEMVGERSERNLFRHSRLKFLYLLACLKAPGVQVERMIDDVAIFLRSCDRPSEFALLYDGLCCRGHTKSAADIYRQAQGGYSPAEREYFAREYVLLMERVNT